MVTLVEFEQLVDGWKGNRLSTSVSLNKTGLCSCTQLTEHAGGLWGELFVVVTIEILRFSTIFMPLETMYIGFSRLFFMK